MKRNQVHRTPLPDGRGSVWGPQPSRDRQGADYHP